jgi:hypothetical protein
MQVTVLGSCTVIDFPEQVEQFFNGNNLADVRNGHRMEMDALPLFFLSQHANDKVLCKRIINAILTNLADSGGQLWRCGVWGHEETHCRFSSVALRLMLLNYQQFESGLVERCLSEHLAHSEEAFGGRWFYHDSIETNNQPYYKTWQGKTCGDASANNMLILNTHLDTLITLLMAKYYEVEVAKTDAFVESGLTALECYADSTEVITGFKAKFDQFTRYFMLRGLGKRDIFSRGSVYLVDRFYYRYLRYGLKHKFNVRAFSDGFLERDIRLTGPSLEYHVVNLWDMSRLLLWLKYTGVCHSAVESYLATSAVSGLQYCLQSNAYRGYLQRISQAKGISNEVLESIAILTMLGYRHDWMANLYLEIRKFAPPSVGILGIDKTISVNGKESVQSIFERETDDVDCIFFNNGLVFVANRGIDELSIDENLFTLEWVGQTNTLASPTVSVLAQSIAVLREIKK